MVKSLYYEYQYVISKRTVYDLWWASPLVILSIIDPRLKRKVLSLEWNWCEDRANGGNESVAVPSNGGAEGCRSCLSLLVELLYFLTNLNC